jgi:hypothetical protein
MFDPPLVSNLEEPSLTKEPRAKNTKAKNIRKNAPEIPRSKRTGFFFMGQVYQAKEKGQ